MTRFIDTNIFVACLRGGANQVRDRFLQHTPGDILVPFQVLAELKLGAAKSARPGHHALLWDSIPQLLPHLPPLGPMPDLAELLG